MIDLPVIVLETDVSAVPASGSTRPGWVSGTPAGLADGVTTTCVFDLGPNWDRYIRTQIAVFPQGATGMSAVQVSSSDTATINPARRLKEEGTPTAQASLETGIYTVPSASAPRSGMFWPMGRYVHVQLTNTAGAGALGPTSKVILAAYPM